LHTFVERLCFGCIVQIDTLNFGYYLCGGMHKKAKFGLFEMFSFVKNFLILIGYI